MILKSEPEIKNRCTKDGVSGQIPAVIPKSGPEIRNHRSAEVVLEGFLASILKFGPEIKNQCSRGIAAVCRRAILLCGDEN